MFIELTDVNGYKELININSISILGHFGTHSAVTVNTGKVREYKESYEEVKAMIELMTKPKIFMPNVGGICED